MALTHPSPNNVPPAPPEGMRWVWHAASADWVLDAALPVPPVTLADRLFPEFGMDREPVNASAKALVGVGMILSGPFMFLCALAAIGALGGVVWFLAQFGIG